MTRQNRPGDGADEHEADGSDRTQHATRASTESRRQRLAELIAGGEAEFPKDLSGDASDALARDVRQLRRDRLIGFIGRAIARAIWRDQKATETMNAENQVRPQKPV